MDHLNFLEMFRLDPDADAIVCKNLGFRDFDVHLRLVCWEVRKHFQHFCRWRCCSVAAHHVWILLLAHLKNFAVLFFFFLNSRSLFT